MRLEARPVVHPREALDGAAQRVGDRVVRLVKRQPDRQALHRARSAQWRRHGSRRRCARESAGRDVDVDSKVTAERALDCPPQTKQTKQLNGGLPLWPAMDVFVVVTPGIEKRQAATVIN